MRHPALPWLLALALACALVSTCAHSDVAQARADDAQGRIRVLEHHTDSLKVQLDSAASQARQRDTVLVRVTDTVNVQVERARTMAHVSYDSVLAHVDSVGALHLDSLVTAHAEEVAALERLAVERLLWGMSWRDAYEAADSVIQAQQATLAQHAILEAALYSAIRSQRRRNLMLKTGTIVLAAGILYGAVK